jgi:phytoene dehydrogenase-like protein
LEGLEKSIEFEQTITPEDFEKKYRANKGSIYGVSSTDFLGFPSPAESRTGHRKSLFVGGATHPGGGIPLVLLSGKFAADLILRDEAEMKEM